MTLRTLLRFLLARSRPTRRRLPGVLMSGNTMTVYRYLSLEALLARPTVTPDRRRHVFPRAEGRVL